MDNQVGEKNWLDGWAQRVVAIGLQPNSAWRPVMRSTEASIPGPALFSILIYDLEQVAEPTLCCLPLWDPNRQGALRGPQ